MFNMLCKLEKLHKPLTILLLISTIAMGYFLYGEHQRNNLQEEEIKKLSSYIDKNIKSLKSNIEDANDTAREARDMAEYIDGYLSR